MRGIWNLSVPRSLLVVFLLVAGLGSIADVSGQTPTSEQVEAFRDLSPEQQRTLLEAMGSSSGQSGTTQSDQRVDTPSTVRPRSTEDERLRNLTLDGEPRLAAGDTLIVELEPVLFEGEERVLTERPRQPTDSLQVQGTTAVAGREGNAVPGDTVRLGQQQTTVGGAPRRNLKRPTCNASSRRCGAAIRIDSTAQVRSTCRVWVSCRSPA